MLQVVQYGGSYQGYLVSTCKRGACVMMKGRAVAGAQTGRLEFRTPASSVDAAKACYLVTWDEKADYTNVVGGSTSNAMDAHLTSTAMKATLHFGGRYRTDQFSFGGVGGAGTGEFTTSTSIISQPFVGFSTSMLWPKNTVAAAGEVITTDHGGGIFTNLGQTSGGFDGAAQARSNTNWRLVGFQFHTAGSLGTGKWIEVEAIKSRVEAGYLGSAAPAWLPLVSY